MNSFDNLYVPDPFSGSILKPPAIWMVEPYVWPSRPYVGDVFDTWTGDKWPFDETTTAPYVPKVPWSEEERRYKEKAQPNPYSQEWLKLLRGEEKKNYKWENLPDGGSKFTLELAGRSKESIAVEINDGKYIIVSSKKITSGAAQIGGTYEIPSPDNLKLDAAQLAMEHGLLTVIFPVKKVEKKSITLL